MIRSALLLGENIRIYYHDRSSDSARFLMAKVTQIDQDDFQLLVYKLDTVFVKNCENIANFRHLPFLITTRFLTSFLTGASEFYIKTVFKRNGSPTPEATCKLGTLKLGESCQLEFLTLVSDK